MTVMPQRARQSSLTWFYFVARYLPFVVAASAADTGDTNRLKPYQTISAGPPPQSPVVFDPDPNKLSLPTSAPPATNWSRRISISSNAPPLPPLQFNPDPGASLKPAVPQSPPPSFHDGVAEPPIVTAQAVTPDPAW